MKKILNIPVKNLVDNYDTYIYIYGNYQSLFIKKSATAL